ncbi:MFS transporter [Pseudonocardia sp. RS11V-5]|uniref:MFS transporter n=1 Tax=Pseudonocardia terrae TaxID=2905831 RepID=UPI001E4E7026|nr:MFS transporter [Pseudonocardia terrae]MCE3556325.1 MFS transporter [Pseudonocardia terrae]
MARDHRTGRRGGRARRWATADGTPYQRPEPEAAAEDAPGTAQSELPPYVPTVRRRYPWHDDPDYDPAEYRREPEANRFAEWIERAPAGEPDEPAPPPVARTAATGGPGETAETGEPGRTGETRKPGQTGQNEEPRTGPTEQRTHPRMPKKLTVTRVAALRSRQLTGAVVNTFRRAATADGADRSGLTSLTYASMMDYAVDAAVAVALANTLFFAAATAESKTNVALYLLITVAPFAVVAPVIGPLLDRLQRGRRAALAVAMLGRAVLAVVMALNYDNWVLYPAALGAMVLSKSFTVLKAAVTPRVLPEGITLATTNSRLTTFGLLAGAVFGGIASGVAYLSGSPGALYYTAALGVVGALLCSRIPRWVEVTAGEVPARLRSTRRSRRRPVGRSVVVALWGNGAARVVTGFLTLFVAFVVKQQAQGDAAQQLYLIGIVGAAAGAGSFLGNGVGSRIHFGRAEAMVIGCVTGACAAAAAAAVLPGILTAAIVGLVAATGSALAKVCLDAVIQRDLPEESRASAFGRSETVLQLAWVFGGALGVLLPHSGFRLGFGVVAAVVAVLGIQTALVWRGRTLVPGLGLREPLPERRPAPSEAASGAP